MTVRADFDPAAGTIRPMAYDPAKARAALAAFQESTRLKDYPWEKASGLGEGTLRQFRNNPTRSFNSSTYSKLAAGAAKILKRSVKVADLQPAEEDETQGTLPIALPERPRASPPESAAPPAIPDRPDVPVWASAAAGLEGAMVLTAEPIDYIRRSELIRDVKEPFAFYVIGDSMSDVIEQGDQVVINPSRPPQPGKDHVFIQTDELSGSMVAMVKRLLRSTATHWRVHQYNPPKDFDLPKSKWPKALRIIEKRYG